MAFESVYYGGGFGKGGIGIIFVNNKSVADTHPPPTEGADEGTHVTEDHNLPFKRLAK